MPSSLNRQVSHPLPHSPPPSASEDFASAEAFSSPASFSQGFFHPLWSLSSLLIRQKRESPAALLLSPEAGRPALIPWMSPT